MNKRRLDHSSQHERLSFFSFFQQTWFTNFMTDLGSMDFKRLARLNHSTFATNQPVGDCLAIHALRLHSSSLAGPLGAKTKVKQSEEEKRGLRRKARKSGGVK